MNARSCGRLTLPLRLSDMKKGQSMVKYTFLFIKFIYYMNMSNITFEVPRLGRSTFVFKKCSDKIYVHD